VEELVRTILASFGFVMIVLGAYLFGGTPHTFWTSISPGIVLMGFCFIAGSFLAKK